MAKFLEDIGKDSKDLLTVDYPTDGTVKLSAQAKPTNGFVIKALLNRGVKRDKTLREVAVATFEPKFEIKQHHLELSGKISSTKEFSGTVARKDLFGVGSKLELTVNRNPETVTGVLGLIYKTDKFASRGKISHPLIAKKAQTKFNVDSVFKSSNVNVGFGAAITTDPATNPVVELNGAFGYEEKNSQFSARVNHTLHTEVVGFGLSFFRILNNVSKWAIDLSSDNTFDRVNVTTGGDYKVDAFTTLKGKLVVKKHKSTDIRTGLSLKQVWAPNVTAIFATDLNTRSFFGDEGGDPHSFGVEVKFEEK
jgi:hypothetical protein